MTTPTGTFIDCAQPVFDKLMTGEEKRIKLPLSYRWELYQPALRRITTAAWVSTSARNRLLVNPSFINSKTLPPEPLLQRRLLNPIQSPFASWARFAVDFSGADRTLDPLMADYLNRKFRASELYGACRSILTPMKRTEKARDSDDAEDAIATVQSLFHGALVLRELDYIMTILANRDRLPEKTIRYGQVYFKFFADILC